MAEGERAPSRKPRRWKPGELGALRSLLRCLGDAGEDGPAPWDEEAGASKV